MRVVKETSDSEESDLLSRVCDSLWPALHQARYYLQSCECPPVHFWRWTHCSDLLSHCVQEMQVEQDDIVPLKSTLLLSSIFERALGNVYLLNGHSVPFLLRDLVTSEELLKVFGTIPMKVAQLLLGSPYAFNIRNVCWHGFPAPNEICMDIAAGLLVLICSFGEILSKTSVNIIPCRPQVSSSDWESHMEALHSAQFPSLKGACSKIPHFIQICHVIPKTHKHYWLTAISYFASGRYGESILLLLPAIEHLLRCLFCMANASPKRILLAEQQSFYTTMDEILAAKVKIADEKSENFIRTLLGDNILNMLMDIFNYSAGPRIRDRISHGECAFNQIPEQIVNHVLCISLLILGKACDLSCLECQTEMNFAINNYSTKFHPASLLLKKFHIIMSKLEKLQYCYQRAGATPNVQSTEISNLLSVLSKHSLNPHCYDISCEIKAHFEKNFPTLYRSKSDMACIGILNKIAVMIEQTILNCLSTLNERFQMYTNHSLRSRQRQTYCRMLECLPFFHSIFTCLVGILLKLLHSLPQQMISFRGLKTVLKYTENMASFSSVEKNRWEEMKNITCNIALQLTSFLDSYYNCQEPSFRMDHNEFQ